MTRSRTSQTLAAIGVTTVLLAAACGGDDHGSRSRAAAAVASTEVVSTASAPPDPAAMAAFQRDVAEQCGAATDTIAALPTEEGTAAGVAAQLAMLTALERSSAFDELTVPEELAAGYEQVVDAGAAASASLAQAVEDAEAGDVASAQQNIDRHESHLYSMDGRLALLGARCFTSDPVRAAGADLNVPLDLGAGHLNTGFGSVWVSQSHGGNVVRVDPATGEILATIDVGDVPGRLQPADGRMWVRTEDAFVAIDPETNSVTDLLEKTEVGPDANRNWALDGTMWICDGRRLHRYDPTTVEPVAVIDLPIDCDFVYEESGLVVVSRYNEDPGESGTSRPR